MLARAQATAKTGSVAVQQQQQRQQQKNEKRNTTSKMQMEEKRRREKEMAKHARSFHHPRWNESEIIASANAIMRVVCNCNVSTAHTCCSVFSKYTNTPAFRILHVDTHLGWST